MKAVTIDNLDLKDHIRFAQDVMNLDTTYLTDAQAVAKHPEHLGVSTIYASQWEALLERQKRNIHWASFSPPSKYHLANKLLFSFCLFPKAFWEDSEESKQEDSEQKKEEKENLPDLFIQVMKTEPKHRSSLFEKDKSCILNLLESIRDLNKLLAHISARKLQYQKG
ncbi:MAG: DUF5399 family protein [Chlamydiales bacterium]|nr:DUF5399 family protein [Chlamydiales bacterium]